MTYYMELRRSEEKGREAGKAEGRAEGIAEGEARGMGKILAALVKDGILTLKDAAKRAGVSEETFRKMAAL